MFGSPGGQYGAGGGASIIHGIGAAHGGGIVATGTHFKCYYNVSGLLPEA